LKKLRFFNTSGIQTRFLYIAFTLKFLASLLLVYIYSNFYTERSEADIFKYFDDSAVIFGALQENPFDFIKLMFGYGTDTEYFFDRYFIHMNNWDRAYDSNVYNDSHTIIKFNAFIRLFSMGVYEVHSLFFCMFSMIGTVAIYKTVQKYFENLKLILQFTLLYLPSLFIWTSGVLKEGILIMAIGLMFYAVHVILENKINKKALFLILLTLFLMMYLKFYVLLAFIPSIIAFILAHYLSFKKASVYTIVVLLFSLLAFNTKHIPPHIDFVKVLVRKQQDFKRLAEWQNAGSEFELTSLEPHFWGVIKVVPEGLFNCFTRPLPWNAKSMIYYPAIIENIFIFMLLMGCILALVNKEIYFKKNAYNLLLFCFIFTFLLFIIIGITTPVSGALVRYKVPALPFLTLGLLYLLQNSKNLNFIERKLKGLGCLKVRG
jgi:hypothetical protein